MIQTDLGILRQIAIKLFSMHKRNNKCLFSTGCFYFSEHYGKGNTIMKAKQKQVISS